MSSGVDGERDSTKATRLICAAASPSVSVNDASSKYAFGGLLSARKPHSAKSQSAFRGDVLWRASPPQASCAASSSAWTTAPPESPAATRDVERISSCRNDGLQVVEALVEDGGVVGLPSRPRVEAVNSDGAHVERERAHESFSHQCVDALPRGPRLVALSDLRGIRKQRRNAHVAQHSPDDEGRACWRRVSARVHDRENARHVEDGLRG